jgi:hypothetical protein
LQVAALARKWLQNNERLAFLWTNTTPRLAILGGLRVVTVLSLLVNQL